MRAPFPAFVLAIGLLALPPGALAQAHPGPATLIAAQRTALQSLHWMDGNWRGTATVTRPDGSRHAITQTERIGPLLDGTVRVIEGRGYEPDGTLSFNAFGVMSFDASTHAYAFHSYAQGHAGDFVLQPTADGYVWTIPMGPSSMRYTASLRDGTWTEIGEMLVPGKSPVQTFRMDLHRIGDSAWPAAGAVPPQ